jgi:hypothetical protein
MPPSEGRSIDVSAVAQALAPSLAESIRTGTRSRLSVAGFDTERAFDDALRSVTELGLEEANLLVLAATLRFGTCFTHGLRVTEIASGEWAVFASDPEAARRLLAAGGHSALTANEICKLLAHHAVVMIAKTDALSRHRKVVRILLRHADSRVLSSEHSNE